MKKIILIFVSVLTLICTNNLSTKAQSFNMLKKLYVVSGSYDTLEYPGYKLIETNINYSVEGIYSATYQEDITERLFTREIEVVSSIVLLNTGIKNVNLKEEVTFENAVILKRINLGVCNIFVIEKNDTIYLDYIYDDSTLEVKLFKSSEFGFIDLVYNKYNNKVYLAGNIYTDSLDVYLAEYSLNGNLLKEKIIKGSNVDTIKNIHITDLYIYLTGYTTSNDQDFNHTSYSEDSFVLKVEIESFNIVKYLNLGEVGIDYLNVSCYLEGLYVVVRYYVSGVPVVKVHYLDDNLEVIYSNYLGTITNVFDVCLKSDGTNVYYFCEVYDDSIKDSVSTLYQITKSLSIKKIDTYYDKLSRAIDLNIVNNEISLLYTSISKEDNYPTYIRILNDKVIKFTLDNRIYDKCYFNEEGNLDLLYGSTLKCFEYSLVYAKTLGNNTSSKDINPVIMCNNILINEDDYLSKINFSPDLFGQYNLIYYYKFDFFDLVYRKDVTVSSELNIDNDNVYTQGLKLSFKGMGYLNNQIIESGYVINDIGDYELKIVGNNNETLVYNFKVVSQDSNKEELLVNTSKLIVEIDELKNVDNVTIENLPVNNKIIEQDYQNNIWYIVIPLVSLLISISTFTLIGRKIK